MSFKEKSRKFNRTRLGQMALMAVQRLQDPYYQGFAAQVGFFYIMSIVPAIIVVSQILNVFNISMDFIEILLERYAPGALGASISEWFASPNTPKTNASMIILAVWASSRAQFTLTRITNYTMSNGRTTGKGYFQERLRSVFSIFITIVSLSFALIVVVFGEQIFDAIVAAIKLNGDTGYNLSEAYSYLRWVVALILYFLMVLLNYYISCTESSGLRLRDFIPGAAFAAIGMFVVTFIYSIYANYVMTAGNYNILYGSSASIVALMFWFWFIAWVQLIGILFNKVLIDTGEGKLREKGTYI